jgi:hypothetical protein
MANYWHEDNRILDKKMTEYWKVGWHIIGQEDGCILSRRMAEYWTRIF